MQGGTRTIHRMKGMDESPFPEEDTAERIVNLTVDESGVWRNSRGVEAIFENQNTCGNVFWWPQKGVGRQWIIWEACADVTDTTTTATLYAFLGGAAAGALEIQTGRHRMDMVPTPGTFFLPVGRWLYIINGYDGYVRWNGSDPAGSGEVVQVGFPQAPPSPRVRVTPAHFEGVTGEPNNGVGPSAGTWKYGYVMTWLNDLGCESPPSEMQIVSGTNASATELNVLAIDLPDAPEHVRAVRLYRTVNLDGVSAAAGERYSLYFLQQFTAGMRIAWMDACADVLLGLEMDVSQTGTIPTGVRLQASWMGRLWLAGSPSYPGRLFYSAPSFIEQFPARNVFDLSGDVTALHATKGALLVFMRGSIHIVRLNANGEPNISTLTQDTGCAAPRSIVEVPGRGVMFLADSGPMMLSGALANEGVPTNVTPLGKAIRRTWDSYADRSNLVNACAVLIADQQEVLFSIPGSPDGESRFMLVYHYVHGWWSRRIWYAYPPFSAACPITDHRGGAIFVASGNLLMLGAPLLALAVDGGFTWSYRSNWIGDRLRRSSIVKLELIGQLTSDPDVDPLALRESPNGYGLCVEWTTDRRLIPDHNDLGSWAVGVPDGVRAITKYVGTGETEQDIDTYAKTWDSTAYWLRPAWRAIPVAVDGDAFEFQFELANPDIPGMGHVRLVGYALEEMTRSISDIRQDTAATTGTR